MSRLAWLTLVVALALVIPSASLSAQCSGYAVAVTSSTKTYSCNVIGGVRPQLSWNLRIDCYDECGALYNSLPTASATANGACAMFPNTVCVPDFNQLEHTNGLYGTTNAFALKIFGGCQNDYLVNTEGSCPCAPTCGGEDPPSIPGDGDNQEAPVSPLLISLGDGRYQLSSPADPVLFDLDADGSLERVTWTARGSDEAFLAVDRNGNGGIDDGMELFGDASPQLPSAEPNGFRALAVYDDPMNGGNGDGWIDRRDAVFDLLLLWQDSNHDGVSQEAELRTLSEGGVEALAVTYQTVLRRDEHGNVFRYRGDVIRAVGPGARLAWDVFFQRVDEP